MGPEARKMVADRVKAKGGALRDQIPDLFELTFGQRQATCEYLSTPNCVVCVCFSVCVHNNWTDGAP